MRYQPVSYTTSACLQSMPWYQFPMSVNRKSLFPINPYGTSSLPWQKFKTMLEVATVNNEKLFGLNRWVLLKKVFDWNCFELFCVRKLVSFKKFSLKVSIDLKKKSFTKFLILKLWQSFFNRSLSSFTQKLRIFFVKTSGSFLFITSLSTEFWNKTF